MIYKIKIQYCLTIGLFLNLLPNCVNAQNEDLANYKAIYRLTYKPSKAENTQEQEDMLLFIGSEYTKFLSLGKHIRDSLWSNKENNSNFITAFRSLPKTKFGYVIVNKFDESKIIYNRRIVKDNFSYEEIPNLEWQISNESKTLSGYLCKKATTVYAGRKYSAWFTPEIPVSSGPYKFGGLPGLIVEISDKENEYQFKLVEFKKIEPTILFDENENTIKTEKAVFLKVLKEYEENPFETVEKSGIKIEFSDISNKIKMLNKHKKELKERNPIELTNE